MKTTFNLLICLLVFCQITVAQKSPGIYEVQIDSVQTLLNKTSKSDTLRVIELNRLARLCIYDLQYERGLTAATEARALAKKINYPQGEGMYLRTLDILHYEDQNTGTYQTLATWYFKDLKIEEYPIAIQSKGQVDRVKRTEALEVASKALEKGGNIEMAAHAFYLLSLTGNNGNALQNIENAERLFATLRLDIPLIQSKIFKVRILKAAGRDLVVQKEELEIVRISEAHENERERALLYINISLYYYLRTPHIDIALDYVYLPPINWNKN